MKRITLIGTGHLASAITKLHRRYYASSAFEMTVMTNSQHKVGQLLSDFEVIRFDPIICQQADMVILAIPAHAVIDFVQRNKNCFKHILIDCSNQVGNGIALEKMLAGTNAQVVKAFTCINVFKILDAQFSVAKVPDYMMIAGNNPQSLDVVQHYINQLGFITQAIPHIKASAELESANYRNFAKWRGPIAASLLLNTLFAGYAIVERNLTYGQPWYGQGLQNLNASLGATALTLFSTVYGAGAVGRLKQTLLQRQLSIENDKLLVSLLDHRKQYGLVATTNVVMHATISMLLFGSNYYQYFSDNNGKWSHLSNSAVVSLLCGVLAFTAYLAISMTSLPSVAKELGMTEWRTVQSYLGWTALSLAALHVWAMGYESLSFESKWRFSLPSLFMLSAVLPTLAVATKFLSLMMRDRPKQRKIENQSTDRFLPSASRACKWMISRQLQSPIPTLPVSVHEPLLGCGP